MGALLAGGGALAWAATAPLVRVASPAATGPAGVGGVPATVSVSDSLLAHAIRRPMFRPGRRPSPVPFDPEHTAGSDAAVPPPNPKPPLLLSGIVWGIEPAAVLEGVPGFEGSIVVRRGERVSGIRVVRIERDRVVLRGLDTTWNLPVREPWK